MLVMLMEDDRMGRCAQSDNHRSCLGGCWRCVVDEILRQRMVPYRNHLTTIFCSFAFYFSMCQRRLITKLLEPGSWKFHSLT